MKIPQRSSIVTSQPQKLYQYQLGGGLGQFRTTLIF